MTKDEYYALREFKRKDSIDARIVVRIDDVGAIEDVYGDNRSYNVYLFRKGRRGSKFYKSAYSFSTANKFLMELQQQINEKKKKEI